MSITTDTGYNRKESWAYSSRTLELGLADRVRAGGWRSLTAKESGRIGGLITKRRRQLREEREA